MGGVGVGIYLGSEPSLLAKYIFEMADVFSISYSFLDSWAKVETGACHFGRRFDGVENNHIKITFPGRLFKFGLAMSLFCVDYNVILQNTPL